MQQELNKTSQHIMSTDLFQMPSPHDTHFRQALTMQAASIDRIRDELSKHAEKLASLPAAAAPSDAPKTTLSKITTVLDTWGVKGGIAAIIGASAILLYQVNELKPAVEKAVAEISDLKKSQAVEAAKLVALKESLEDHKKVTSDENKQIVADLKTIISNTGKK